MSVIYGSGAFFGAINIITNYTTEDKGVNVISASGGSMGTMKTAARFSGRTGDLSFAFSAGYYNTNGPDEPLSKMATYEPDWAGIDSTNNTTKGRLEDDNKYFNLSVDYKGF
jgi:outer membrane receptor for ferrienterochelin and colicins